MNEFDPSTIRGAAYDALRERQLAATEELKSVDQRRLVRLLPCPFCGSEPIITGFSDTNDEWRTCIQCQSCTQAHTHGYLDEDLAFKAWNRRHGEPNAESIRAELNL